MQGVDVTGIIVWSIHRADDGPFKAYKFFGENLKRDIPTKANDKLGSIANSIVRDRIANMTLNDILKNRSKIRNGV